MGMKIGSFEVPNVGGWVNDRRKELGSWARDPVGEAVKSGKRQVSEANQNLNNAKAWVKDPGKEAGKTLRNAKAWARERKNEAGKTLQRLTGFDPARPMRRPDVQPGPAPKVQITSTLSREQQKTAAKHNAANEQSRQNAIARQRGPGSKQTAGSERPLKDGEVKQGTSADGSVVRGIAKGGKVTWVNQHGASWVLPAGAEPSNFNMSRPGKAQPTLAQAEKRLNDYAGQYEKKANGKAGVQKTMDWMRKGFNEGYGDDQFKNIGKSSKALAALKADVRSGKLTQAEADRASSVIVKKFNAEEARVTRAQADNAEVGKSVHGAGRVVVVGGSAIVATGMSGGNIFVGAAAAGGAGSLYDAATVLDQGTSAIAPKLDGGQSLGGVAAQGFKGKKINLGDVARAGLGTATDSLNGAFAGRGVQVAKAAQLSVQQLAIQSGGQATRQSLVKAVAWSGVKNTTLQTGAETGLKTAGIAVDTSLTGKQKIQKAKQNAVQTVRQLPVQLVTGGFSSGAGIATQLKNAPANAAVQFAVDGVTNLAQASIGNNMAGKGFGLSKADVAGAAVQSVGGAIQNVAQQPRQGAGGAQTNPAGKSKSPKTSTSAKPVTTAQRFDALGKAVEAFNGQPGQAAAAKIKTAQQELNSHRDEMRAQGTWSSADAAAYKAVLKQYANADRIAAQYQAGVTPPDANTTVKSTQASRTNKRSQLANTAAEIKTASANKNSAAPSARQRTDGNKGNEASVNKKSLPGASERKALPPSRNETQQIYGPDGAIIATTYVANNGARTHTRGSNNTVSFVGRPDYNIVMQSTGNQGESGRNWTPAKIKSDWAEVARLGGVSALSDSNLLKIHHRTQKILTQDTNLSPEDRADFTEKIVRTSAEKTRRAGLIDPSKWNLKMGESVFGKIPEAKNSFPLQPNFGMGSTNNKLAAPVTFTDPITGAIVTSQNDGRITSNDTSGPTNIVASQPDRSTIRPDAYQALERVGFQRNGPRFSVKLGDYSVVMDIWNQRDPRQIIDISQIPVNVTPSSSDDAIDRAANWLASTMPASAGWAVKAGAPAATVGMNEVGLNAGNYIEIGNLEAAVIAGQVLHNPNAAPGQQYRLNTKQNTAGENVMTIPLSITVGVRLGVSPTSIPMMPDIGVSLSFGRSSEIKTILSGVINNSLLDSINSGLNNPLAKQIWKDAGDLNYRHVRQINFALPGSIAREGSYTLPASWNTLQGNIVPQENRDNKSLWSTYTSGVGTIGLPKSWDISELKPKIGFKTERVEVPQPDFREKIRGVYDLPAQGGAIARPQSVNPFIFTATSDGSTLVEVLPEESNLTRRVGEWVVPDVKGMLIAGNRQESTIMPGAVLNAINNYPVKRSDLPLITDFLISLKNSRNNDLTIRSAIYEIMSGLTIDQPLPVASQEQIRQVIRNYAADAR